VTRLWCVGVGREEGAVKVGYAEMLTGHEKTTVVARVECMG